jgi:hypothetical protein
MSITVRFRQFVERRISLLDAGVVECTVEAPELSYGTLHECRDIPLVSDIRLDNDSLHAQLLRVLRRLPRTILVQIRKSQRRTCVSKRVRSRATDPAPRPRDDYYLPVE